MRSLTVHDQEFLSGENLALIAGHFYTNTAGIICCVTDNIVGKYLSARDLLGPFSQSRLVI